MKYDTVKDGVRRFKGGLPSYSFMSVEEEIESLEEDNEVDSEDENDNEDDN